MRFVFRVLGALVEWLRSVVGRLGGAVSGALRRPRSFLSGALVAVAAIGLLVAVFLSDGFKARAYDLEDAYVWVTHDSDVMRYNRETEQLDWRATSDPDGGESDVIQDGIDVFVVQSGGWSKVDVAEQAFEPMTGLGSEASAAVGGGRFAVLDRDGGLWVSPVDRAIELAVDSGAVEPESEGEDLSGESEAAAGDESAGEASSGKDREKSEAVFDAGEGAVVAVGRFGDVAVLDGAGDRLVLVGTQQSAEPVVTEVDGDLADSDVVEVTLVGRSPVALVGTSLVLPDGSVQEIEADSARLQLPGEAGDEVLVATETDLLAVPLGGGEPRVVTEGVTYEVVKGQAGEATSDPVAGVPQRPVAVGGNRAAVWSGEGARVYWSAGDVELAQLRPGFSEAQLRFRVNRNNVVLNNITDGEVYVLIDGELRTSTWQDAQPDETEPENDPEAEEENPISFDPTENRPVAHDDKYGARPGLPTIMHPLDNDKDPDSDVLTIELDADSVKASRARVELVEGAQGLQVTPPNDEAPFSFQYRAYDGNPVKEEGVSEWATVSVTVYGADTNNGPKLKNNRKPHLDVGAKSSADYQVLQDYEDPEGDPIYLADATPEDKSQGSVAARANGKLTYTDLAGEAGETYASVDVRDAPMLVGVASLPADGARLGVMVSAEDLDPLARNDYVTTLVDTPVVVQPLANDEDPNGDTLSFELVGLENLPGGASATKNPDNTVTVTSPSVGPLSFGYELSAGGRTATARIRVDVADANERVAPSAGLDLVVLPRPTEGRTAERTVDLLANDYSPQGDVLVATGLSGLDESNPGASVLTAQLLELRRLRVQSDAPPQSPVRFTYSLSDGVNEVDGIVVVIGSDKDQNLPPVTTDDTVTVRSGDIVSVPVLANDIDPEGARLYLGPEVKALDENDGTAWAAGSRVRFVAPRVPLNQTDTIDLSYVAYDGEGPDFSTAKGTPGRLRVRVTNPGADSNSDPRPRPVEARVLAGKQVKITVPTSGIDPDGDSVVLVGIGFRNGEPHAPTKGRIVGEPGVDSFVYEAFEDQSSTDVFSYKVVDSGGAEGFAQVRVGVARGNQNQAPVALRDRYEVLPGAPLLIDPLANDIDSDGDPIDFVADDPFIGYDGPLSPRVEARKNGSSNRVRLDIPDEDGYADSVPYRIADPVGATGESKIVVLVSSEAVGRPPIARDDRATVDDPDLTSVQVPVLDNDSDPDGDVADLELSVIGSNATVVEVDGESRLEIPLTDQPQIVVYRITDAQELTAHAVVRVPAAGEGVNQPPLWKAAGPCADEVEMPSGRTERGIVFEGADGPQTIDLAECGFSDPEGNKVRFVSEKSLQSGVTGKLAAAVKDPTVFTVNDTKGGTSPYVDVLTLVVTDAPDGDTGKEILVQVPVGVIAETDKAVNEPPRWRQTTSIQVTQDGEPSLPVDLTRLVEDPEDDDLTFTAEVGRGLSVDGNPEDGTLRLIGSKDLPLGDGAASVTVSVTDGQDDHEPVEAEFSVSGIMTNKAMPTLRPVATVDDATRGERSTVNVLEGSTDPVGEGLQVVSAEAGANPGEVSFDPGGDVGFTPARVGPATVSFVVADDLGREVAGTVTYSVAAPPDPPTTPQVLDFTYNSVSLRWGQAEDNASPIERYDITARPGGATASCGTELSCTVGGLTPGTAYTFTVTATNEKGEGKPSPASAPATPDECPKAPQNVSLSFVAESNPATGGHLVARWSRPENNGTPIAGYEISVEPGGQVLNPGPSAAQQEITGLTNGTEHNITIRARNQCEGEWGEEALAGPATPAGRPAAPTGVSATVIDDRVGGRVSLQWNAPTSSGSPSNNGDEVSEYTIREVSGRRPTETIQASQVSLAGSAATYELAVDRQQPDLRFTVEATNKAGTGTASGASQPVSAPSAPGAPGINAVTATGQNGQVNIAWTPPADTGGAASIQQVQYRSNVDPTWRNLPGSNLIDGLANGQSYTVQLRALNERYPSDPSAQSGAVVPYGPLGEVTLTGSEPANQPYANFSWTTPSGNGREITSRRVTVNGALVSSAASGSARTSPNAWSTTFTVEVRVEDAAGQVKTAVKQFTTSAEPLPHWSTKLQGSRGADSFANTNTSGGSVRIPAWTTVTIACKTAVPTGVADSARPYWYRVTSPGGYAGYAASNTFYLGYDSNGNPVDYPGNSSFDPRVPDC